MLNFRKRSFVNVVKERKLIKKNKSRNLRTVAKQIKETTVIYVENR